MPAPLAAAVDLAHATTPSPTPPRPVSRAYAARAHSARPVSRAHAGLAHAARPATTPRRALNPTLDLPGAVNAHSDPHSRLNRTFAVAGCSSVWL